MKQRYDSYKSSGIDWIGDIPSHWEISPIKHICRSEKYAIKTGPFGSQLKGEDLKEEGDIRVYNQRNVIDSDFSEVSNYVTTLKAKDLESFYTLPNDILVTSRGTIGKSAILPDDAVMGILHPCLIALRIDESKANLSWIQRWINESDSFSREIEAKSNATTIDVIYTETIKNIRVVLPPLAEQEAIAEWLDETCGEIDAAISKVNRELELIDELKQSEISRVVTRGLNPDESLRPSGIDWIGDIPEHWEMVPLKSVVSYNDEVWSEMTDKDKNISYVEIGDVSQVNGVEKWTDYTFIDAPSRARRIARKDDVIISTVRTYLRAIARIKEDGLTVSTGFMVLRAKSIDSVFLSYAVLNDTFIQEVIAKSTGVSYPAINSTDVSNIKIPVPPLSEQKDIADYLDKKCAEIDGLKAKLVKKRETLKELRHTIISEVVTGKRKVI